MASHRQGAQPGRQHRVLHGLPTFAWVAALAFAGGALLGGLDYGKTDAQAATDAAANPGPSQSPSLTPAPTQSPSPTPTPSATKVVTATPAPTAARPAAPVPRRLVAPSARPAPTTPVQGRITALVKLQRTKIGTVVADDRGHTAYRYDRDGRQPSQSRCYGRCARSWLPLLVDDATLAAAGLDMSRFGLVERRDGGRQLTYRGWPLYVYKGDPQPGSLRGNDGAYGTWHAALH